MKFSFMLSADAQAGDQLDDLRDQLEDLGHEFAISRGTFLPPPWYNLVCEGVSEATPERTAALALAGYLVVMLVTEKPTLVTAEGLVWNYHTTGAWITRAEQFVASAPHYSAAWCYAPGAAKAIKRFMPRAADVDMGWGKRFLAKRMPARPAFDFCFFGGPTQRRDRVINELRARGRTVDVIPHSSTLHARDGRVPSAKVVLDIKQYAWWDLVSSVRYVTALLCGRPVIAEARPEEAKGDWKDVVDFAGEHDFFQRAEAMLKNWEATYKRQVAALREKPSTMKDALRVLPPAPKTNGVALPYHPSRGMIDINTPAPKLIESLNGMNLVGWKGSVFAIPQQLGTVHIDKVDLLHFPTIRRFSSYQEAEKGLTR